MLLVASLSSWGVGVPDSSLARSEVASVLHTLSSDDSARKLRPTTDAREDIELGKPVDWTGDGQNQRGLMTITTPTSSTQTVPDGRLLVKALPCTPAGKHDDKEPNTVFCRCHVGVASSRTTGLRIPSG